MLEPEGGNIGSPSDPEKGLRLRGARVDEATNRGGLDRMSTEGVCGWKLSGRTVGERCGSFPRQGREAWPHVAGKGRPSPEGETVPLLRG